MKIERVNQVWATDITWMPMKQGFMYLMAIIDLKSRYVVEWSLSNTMMQLGVAKYLKQLSQNTASQRFLILIKEVRLHL